MVFAHHQFLPSSRLVTADETSWFEHTSAAFFISQTYTRFSRKEVIQAHLPVHLPCYDFVPVTNPTFDGSILAVRIPASGVASFHDVTGGVYKTRERIHRTVADARLLATPTSCRRVAACNLNCGQLYGLAPLRSFATYCTDHCSVCVAPDIKAMLT